MEGQPHHDHAAEISRIKISKCLVKYSSQEISSPLKVLFFKVRLHSREKRRKTAFLLLRK